MVPRGSAPYGSGTKNPINTMVFPQLKQCREITVTFPLEYYIVEVVKILEA